MNISVKCTECSKVFVSYQALGSHIRWMHKNKLSLKCDICGKQFKYTYNLRRHQSVHVIEPSKGYLACCPVCQLQANKKALKEHFKEHGLQIESDEFKFESLNDFFNWKRKIEKETNTRFVIGRSKRKTKDGTLVTTYYCQRDGKFNPRGSGLRSLKICGSVKINGYCPASMELKEDTNGKVSVKFTKTHVGHKNEIKKNLARMRSKVNMVYLNANVDHGHENEIRRLLFSKEQKKQIEGKLKLKLPIDDILDEIRIGLEDENILRMDPCTRLDIFRTYNLNNDVVLSSSDIENVDIWVRQMQEHSVVLLYKPQDYLALEYTQLKERDFCLILANDCQLDTLKKYGNNAVCINGISSIRCDDFNLFTVVVVDTSWNAYPCAYMITNRKDSFIMEMFFRVLLENLKGEVITPKYFMSDMTELIVNNWVSVFPAVTNHLFNIWDVDREWRQEIVKIKGKKLIQIEVFHMLMALMTEKDVNTFDILKNFLLKFLYSSHHTREFAPYFEKFLSESKKWAYCYRIDDGISTNTSLENLNRSLKIIFIESIKIKRLDKGIFALMQYVRDQMFHNIVEIDQGEITKKSAVLSNRHKVSLELPVNAVTSVSDTNWLIVSSGGVEFYEITKIKDTCTCQLYCGECSACIHMFNCTCEDCSISWNMCKHIHLVCRATGHSIPEPVKLEETVVESNVLVIDFSSATNSNASQDLTSLEEEKQQELAKMKEIFDSIIMKEGLEAFKRHVAPLADLIKAAQEKAAFEFFQLPGTSEEPEEKDKEPSSSINIISTKDKSLPKKVTLRKVGDEQEILAAIMTMEVEISSTNDE